MLEWYDLFFGIALSFVLFFGAFGFGIVLQKITKRDGDDFLGAYIVMLGAALWFFYLWRAK